MPSPTDPLLSANSCAACKRAMSAALDALPYIARLEEVAKVLPGLAEIVQQLRTRRDYIYEAAQAALGADRALSTGGV